ncbi:hypothetical protein [Bradyrhizobium sp. F1.13.3]|uniref:hypothetical protein n=1 Tax=Bradyrhizobium sp. F1.13.3 TaxID=3156351 RepID=UPI0033946ACB
MMSLTAEVIVMEPHEVPGVLAALDTLGCEITELADWVDHESGARWFAATMETVLSPDEFERKLASAIIMGGGDVVQVGETEAWWAWAHALPP